MGISFFPDMGNPRENQTGVALDSAKRTPWKGKAPPHTQVKEGASKETARVNTHGIPTELTESTLRQRSPKRADTAQQQHQSSQPFQLPLSPHFPAAKNIPRGSKIIQVSEEQCAKSLQSYLTLHNPMDCSPRGSSVHGILQARTLGGVAVLFSRGSS